MPNKGLVILMAIAALGVSSAAMARGGGGSGGGHSHHGGNSASVPEKSGLAWRLGLGRALR
jgi:hypothetical protein